MTKHSDGRSNINMIGAEDVSKISFHESRINNNNATPPDQMSPIGHPNQNFDQRSSNNFIQNNLQQLESEPKLRKKNTLKYVPEVKRSIDKDDIKRSSEEIEYNPNSPSRVRGAV